MKMQRNFVTFYSPGTFLAEESTYPIDTWDTNAAVELARSVKERYNARPFGFKFTTRSRGDAELDSAVSATSCFYWLGGRVETIADVEARGDPSDKILLSNMRGNGYEKIVVNTNSAKWTQPLGKGDIILDVKL